MSVRFRNQINLKLHYLFQLLETTALSEDSYIKYVFRTESLYRTQVTILNKCL
jgi:hypothetical protein